MSTENEWECTELVKRYLYQAYGLDSISGSGGQIVDNYYNAYGSGANARVARVINNGSVHQFPQVGDVFSHSYGHTSIVSAVTNADPSTGNATLTIIEQNYSASGQRTLSVTGWTVSDSVSGWLHPLGWQEISPAAQSGVLGTNITSMSAVSATNVWAVGHYKNPTWGQWWPFMQQYNGSTWTVKSPGPPSQNASHNLYGTAATAGGNVWAVGWRGDTHGTLAYKWNGTAWVGVVSDNGTAPGVSGDNYLRAVADDGNGHIWAVGYYQANGYSCPSGRGSLIERYDPTALNGQGKFIAVANAPPTTACAELYGVTVTSATNAWAVGRYFDGSNVAHLLILHYDGTSWTQDTSVTATCSGGYFTGVYAPTDTEAWAVGNWPMLIYHYKNGAWSQDTSISTILSNTKLYGVAGSAADDVWIAGSYSPSTGTTAPFMLHWDGAEWVYYNTTYPTGQVNVEAWGVASRSYKAWFGGYRQPSNTFNAYPFVQEFGH